MQSVKKGRGAGQEDAVRSAQLGPPLLAAGVPGTASLNNPRAGNVVTRVANDCRPGRLMESEIMVKFKILGTILCHDYAAVVD